MTGADHSVRCFSRLGYGAVHERDDTFRSGDRRGRRACARRRGVRALHGADRSAPAPVGADYVDLIARGTTWVAEHDGRIVGFVVLIRRPDHLVLDNVAVAPDAQGLGIGAQLSAEAWVCRTHLSHPALQTPRSVPAAGMAGHRESVNIVDR
jgi:hypothetical protein